MNNEEMGNALDVVIGSLQDLKEVKEGFIRIEVRDRQRGLDSVLRDPPMTSRPKRGVIIAKNSKALLKLLVVQPKSSLGYTAESAEVSHLFTKESRVRYAEKYRELTKHPKFDRVTEANKVVEGKRKLLYQERDGRMAELIHTFEEITMELISGTTPLSEFPRIKEVLECRVF